MTTQNRVSDYAANWSELELDLSLSPRVTDELTPGREEPFELTDDQGRVIGDALVAHDVANGVAHVRRLRWDPSLASEADARRALARQFGTE